MPDRTSTLKQSFFWSVLVFHLSGWLFFLLPLPLPHSSLSYTFPYGRKNADRAERRCKRNRKHCLKFCRRARYSTAICKKRGPRKPFISAPRRGRYFIVCKCAIFCGTLHLFFFFLFSNPFQYTKRKKEPCHGHHLGRRRGRDPAYFSPGPNAPFMLPSLP